MCACSCVCVCVRVCVCVSCHHPLALQGDGNQESSVDDGKPTATAATKTTTIAAGMTKGNGDDDDRLQTTMTTSCKSFTEFSSANAAGAYIDYKPCGIILV